MRIDTVLTDVRVFPLLDITRAQLERAAGAPITSVERVDGGLTNTIHKVTLEDGDVLGIKHYAGGKEWFETELTTLTLLHGTVPVPEIVNVDLERLVIAYRWIDGITLHELRKRGNHDAFASLAEPLGRALAWISHTDATSPFELTHILEHSYRQLTTGRARLRLGAALADALLKSMEAAEPQMAFGAVCLSHGDLGHRNVIVHQAGGRWRINGIIDWETTTTSSPLADVGSLFRYSQRYDGDFVVAFERGYRDAGGELPDDWLLTARLLDATWLVDMLDDEGDHPQVFEDCVRLVATLVADVH
ncbi:MAG: aminoglycoside phosphotransferase family protein [Kofleriaceae bacterium]|nr:aminoglycoside phosphotransferase family protein [Kofleriaceae bacterium]